MYTINQASLGMNYHCRDGHTAYRYVRFFPRRTGLTTN
jgi:hypothetical protein